MAGASSIACVATLAAAVLLGDGGGRAASAPAPRARLSLPAPAPGPCGSREALAAASGSGAYVGCGPLAAFVIRDAVVARAPALERCGADVTAEARFVVAWTIGPDGSVRAAHATVVPAGGEDVAACLVREVRQLVFPSPLGGATVDVSFPFVFRAVAPAATAPPR